jgi:hypothetical protein
MQLFIKDAGQAQPPHDFQLRRKTIDPFGSKVHLKDHPLSLSNNSRFSQIFQRMVIQIAPPHLIFSATAICSIRFFKNEHKSAFLVFPNSGAHPD